VDPTTSPPSSFVSPCWSRLYRADTCCRLESHLRCRPDSLLATLSSTTSVAAEPYLRYCRLRLSSLISVAADSYLRYRRLRHVLHKASRRSLKEKSLSSATAHTHGRGDLSDGVIWVCEATDTYSPLPQTVPLPTPTLPASGWFVAPLRRPLPHPSSSPKRMEGEGVEDDGLEPLFPLVGGASSCGLNLFCQIDLTGGVQASQTGMESLDLNS
jgi:hypothetical protein